MKNGVLIIVILIVGVAAYLYYAKKQDHFDELIGNVSSLIDKVCECKPKDVNCLQGVSTELQTLFKQFADKSMQPSPEQRDQLIVLSTKYQKCISRSMQ